MEAAIYHGRADIRIQDSGKQNLGGEDVRLEVEACGICGSDLHEFTSGPIAILKDEPHPQTGGETPADAWTRILRNRNRNGANVDSLTEGDTIISNPIIACGGCRIVLLANTYFAIR